MPSVSIILPTYNRARFLPKAFESISSQSFTDWELIVVDDGSTDNTRSLVDALGDSIPGRVRYIHQANQGAYGARNTGLDQARGKFIAFFDSDDVWLPHHLKNCVEALEQNPDVDWVYAACRIENLVTQKVEAPNTFYVKGRPRKFLALRTRVSNKLKIIEDRDATRCMIENGFYCGPQNSVLRKTIHEQFRFATEYRNEAEDRLMVLRALTAGYRFGYLDDVHVVYYIHDANSSSSASGGPVNKNVKIAQALIQGYEDLRHRIRLSPIESRALNQKLGREYFWHLGYSLLWSHGRREEALQAFRKGISYWPWNIWFWKTYLFALARNRRETGHPIL